jgi:putative ATP-dependent endonuclease of OLD family
MAKIHSLKIKNFRGIQNFEFCFGFIDFICLIGRGDSGKTTLLDAIYAVLSPNWNHSFYDSDFYQADIANPIEIEATLYSLPKSLLNENKYGLHIRGIDKVTGAICDDLQDDHEIALTIKLVVDKDLEPKWYIESYRDGQDKVEIRANDRASLNVHLISDYLDTHFTWSKGFPLFSLLKQADSGDLKTDIVTEALREAKHRIDEADFPNLSAVVSRVIATAAHFGVDIQDATTSLDSKDLSNMDRRMSFHQSRVPFRLKGKGTKRLLSIAIQTELSKEGGVLLVDEIEQGLEPDRVKHLIRTLKARNTGQVFLTTHSRDVVVELEAVNLYKMKVGRIGLIAFDESLQPLLRSNPEPFFANRVLVCEGKTEYGVFRSIDQHRIQNHHSGAVLLGVHFAVGHGSSSAEYAEGFRRAGYDVCLFCDSDEPSMNSKKSTLLAHGITVVDCESGNSIEDQVFNDLPWRGVRDLLENLPNVSIDSIEYSVKRMYEEFGELPSDWLEVDRREIRCILGKLSNQDEWFKRIDKGEYLGNVCCRYLFQSKDCRIGQEIASICEWMDNA